MKIRKGITLPQFCIRRDLTRFVHGGWDSAFVGLPLISIRAQGAYKPLSFQEFESLDAERTVVIKFINPWDGNELSYNMRKSEICIEYHTT